MRGRSSAVWWLPVAASFLAACQTGSIATEAEPSGGLQKNAENSPFRGADLAREPASDFCGPARRTKIVNANPGTYRELLQRLVAGDTLLLAPGDYPRLSIAGLHGMPGRCIRITGPATLRRATIVGEPGHRTVDIIDSSYIVVSNLVIDSRGIPGADGVKAPAAGQSAPHHVVLDGNLIIGAGATQQTDGISTKAPAWNWVIRRNTIVEAGTGVYLGDSDGTAPFIAGVIENNVIVNPTGYGMQIKYQTTRLQLAGIPQGPQSTIIRNNEIGKDSRPSPDGDRPNLLVGGFPDSGPGSADLYQVYGNRLLGNPREALFQGSGRISFHDNVLNGGGPAAAVFRDHDLPLRWVQVFDNRIRSPHIGIRFDSLPRQGYSVHGNTIDAVIPVSGPAGGV